MKHRVLLFFLSTIFLINGANTQTVTLKQISKSNNLISTNTFFSAHIGKAFYTIDRTGALYKTDLDSGSYTRLGKANFNNAKLIFTLNRKVYVIENDGSMTQVDPFTGAWNFVSSMGYWTNITSVLVVANTLFAIENGAMYRYNGFNTNTRKQIGDAEFYNIGTFFTDDSTIYSLSDDKSFYEINTGTGKWTKIGKSKSWKGSLSATGLRSKLYTVDNEGKFYETALADGIKKQLDDTQFKKARFLFSESGKLYLTTSDGYLYEILLN